MGRSAAHGDTAGVSRREGDEPRQGQGYKRHALLPSGEFLSSNAYSMTPFAPAALAVWVWQAIAATASHRLVARWRDSRVRDLPRPAFREENRPNHTKHR